jgi:hypothetical protein
MLRRYPPHWREAWRITRGLVLRLRRSVESHWARLAVVVVNSREEVSAARLGAARALYSSIATADLDPDKPNRLITRFLARRRIPTIELLGSFRTRFAGDGTPGFNIVDMHWTATGHALAAEIVAERLLAMDLVRARGVAPIEAPTSVR